MSRGRRLLALPLVLLVVAATAACTSDEPAVASPFAGCDTLIAPPPSAAPPSAPQPAASAGGLALASLPDLTLPCFDGDDEVSLRELRGPAVINLWASWCGPCRAELPVMQSLADRTTGRLTVLGVDTGDQRDKGASFATDAGVRMPTLFDEKSTLLNNLGRISLPITVFLDPAGRAYAHLLPLEAPELAELVRTHTGVTVTP
ncbi:thiol-disulfide isomerase/thioredoxin [Paractinoplanes brasiliensis]|uniref:Thiol-disulfide isomerase/thioredoxin n=2 Tax=Paractinoplanes brasiliensis TaxID=52695 RepID=A0A4R6JVD8_9ACTN|nr:thiol-disulfide isomerase/thioredoxin [Actinoplanes brasiliensis]